MGNLFTVEELSKMEPNFGPTGQVVYERSYSRTKQDGLKESWIETVTRTVDGNIALVDSKFIETDERLKLMNLFFFGNALPAGRHLWMSGVPGRQFLFNCHVAHWDGELTDHFTFTFDQLMQGGGVGSNYSNRYISKFPTVKNAVDVHFVCDTRHPDYDIVKPYLSEDYSPEWPGNIQIDDSREGWCDAQARVVQSAYSKKAEALVFDISRIREKGATIRSFGGVSAGPEPLVQMLTKYQTVFNSVNGGEKLSSLDMMALDHFTGEAVVSGNVRRSARMSIKSWKDDDIFDFIHCKTDPELHWSTNISVEIDDDFFRAYKRANPQALAVYQEVTKGMLENGEPGFWNRSLSSVGEVNEIVSTNPCGEIPLEPWGNCNLGHINLSAFYDDRDGVTEAHRLMTRFLVRATFGDVPNDKQREVNEKSRRIGVGHFGFQGWLNKQGIRYSDSHNSSFVRDCLKDFKRTVRQAARDYAFELRIPEPIKVTTEAPTGTIAKLFGTTEGIHPILYTYFERRVRFADTDPAVVREFDKGFSVEKAQMEPNTAIVVYPTRDMLIDEVAAIHGWTDAEQIVESAYDIPIEDMLAVQEMVQRHYADNAVSFTINLPEATSLTALRGSLIHYLPRLKGTTIFPDSTRPQAPYTAITKEQYESYDSTDVSDGIDENCAGGSCPIGNEAIK